MDGANSGRASGGGAADGGAAGGGDGGDPFMSYLASDSGLGEDFNMLLPPIDGSEFLCAEDLDKAVDMDKTSAQSDSEEERSSTRRAASPPPRGIKSGITTKGAKDEADKKAKRRKQIAAASRASRARRKRELEDLREENQKLRKERNSFLSKIGELQVKVESMRERGSTDMRVENALLRAQLEEHKRFVSHFKHLCDGATTTLGARQMIYQQGSDSAQAHVLGLVSQSLADGWTPGVTPPDADIPYQNFFFSYKFKDEYGEKAGGAAPRQRLNVRVDLTFPGLQSAVVSDFLWNSFSNVDIQQRLYRVDNIELTQLADDMPDKDTKMVYFREKLEAPSKDQDWVVLCKRASKDLARSTLALPPCHGVAEPAGARARFGGLFGGLMGGSATAPPAKRAKQEVPKVPASVLAMSTTQHSVAPQFDNANRITSMFFQGAVTWDEGGDARLVIVFSFPDDFRIKAMKGFSDVVRPDGTMSLKFAQVLHEFKQMLGEQQGPLGTL